MGFTMPESRLIGTSQVLSVSPECCPTGEVDAPR
jgi:hypothetical protein